MLRKPAVAGTFYPDNPEILKKTIEDCFINKFGVDELNKIINSAIHLDCRVEF